VYLTRRPEETAQYGASKLAFFTASILMIVNQGRRITVGAAGIKKIINTDILRCNEEN
jgi:hypothetical protein